MIVWLNMDRGGAVDVRLAPTDTRAGSSTSARALFSKPLRVGLRRNRTTFVYFRLFELVARSFEFPALCQRGARHSG